ncbi:FadR/GntR family transcriptional regulator [Cryptosporangium arvum]|uniref:FadR/GntR family transcriptional regulator n=1 Tax=Cryptosporangium arvum TaxID=80871 RepID=UPI0004BCDFA0|nr:GntR family transcriptional regulator [Cryptosporangium arvum]
MTFSPIARGGVSDAVYRQLRDAILTGSLAAGSALPGERALAEEFGVARHGLREAIRRLQQARLVEVSHGGATRVLDWRVSAGLELLGDLAASLDSPGGEILRSALEMRLAIGVDAARLAAARASAGAAAEIEGFVTGSTGVTDPDVLAERYEQFWRLIIVAGDNLAYQLSYNSLVLAMNQNADVTRELSAPEAADLATQRVLAAAIASGDVDGAASAARRLTSVMLARLR